MPRVSLRHPQKPTLSNSVHWAFFVIVAPVCLVLQFYLELISRGLLHVEPVDAMHWTWIILHLTEGFLSLFKEVCFKFLSNRFMIHILMIVFLPLGFFCTPPSSGQGLPVAKITSTLTSVVACKYVNNLCLAARWISKTLTSPLNSLVGSCELRLVNQSWTSSFAVRVSNANQISCLKTHLVRHQEYYSFSSL